MLQQGSATSITSPRTQASRPLKSRRKTIVWTCGPILAFVVLAVGFYFISANWPYRYRKIHPLLEDVFASQVKITQYHRTYFPNLGFVATGIILHRKSAPDLPPLGTVETLFVQGRWSDLLMLRQRVQLVDVTGLHIIVPAVGMRHDRLQYLSSNTFLGSCKTRFEDLFLDFAHQGGELNLDQFETNEEALDVLERAIRSGNQLTIVGTIANILDFIEQDLVYRDEELPPLPPQYSIPLS